MRRAPALPRHPPSNAAAATAHRRRSCRCRRDGQRSGHAEGRALGLQKGFELGHEVGFYSGCCQLWRQLQARDPQLFGCVTAWLTGVARLPTSHLLAADLVSY